MCVFFEGRGGGLRSLVFGVFLSLGSCLWGLASGVLFWSCLLFGLLCVRDSVFVSVLVSVSLSELASKVAR